MQIEPTSNTPSLLSTSSAEPKKIEGSWWGGYLLGVMTQHEPPQILTNNPKCQHLIEEVAAESVQLLFKNNQSSFLEGGKENIEIAVRDVAIQIFTTLSTQETIEDLNDDRRIDHFVFTILQVIKEEFKTEAPNKEHFKHIADTLLTKAYPQKERDPRLPSLLRALISEKWSLTRWAAQKATNIEFGWKKLTEEFAKQLEGMYASINLVESSQKATTPEIDELAEGLMKQVDALAKTSSPLRINIPEFSDESTTFLNAFLTRLMQNNFANEEEATLLLEARVWLLSQLKSVTIIVLKEAIVKKDPEFKNPEKALAEIVNDILKKGRAAALQFAADPTLNEQDFLIQTSREILGNIISKELFNSLLPPLLKGSTLWEDSAALLANKLLKGLFEQTQKTQEIKLQVEELRPFLAEIQSSILEQLKKSEEIGKETSSLDRLTDDLLRGEGVKDIVKEVLPNLMEAILAYHVNPKEGIVSEEQAAALIMKLLNEIQKVVEKIDDYERVHQAEISIEMRDYFFHQAAEEMMGILLPKELLEEIIPKEFAGLQIEGLLADFSYSYIKDAYSYSRIMKQVTKPNDKTSQEWAKYAKRLIDNSLASNLADKKENSWIKEVVGKVFSSTGKERKLLDDFITNVLLGTIGFMLKRDVMTESTGGGEDLKPLFVSLVKQMQDVFRSLNERKEDTSEAYSAAAEHALEMIFPKEKWEQIIPEVARSAFTKKDAAVLLAGGYETLHETQKVLAKEEKNAREVIKEHESLQEYLEEQIVENLRGLLAEEGKRDKKFSEKLPESLDQLFKQFLRGEDRELCPMRDALLDGLIYSSMGEVLNEQENSVVGKVKKLLASYQAKDNKATTELLFNTLLSKELRETVLIKSILTEEMRDSVAALVQQVHESQARIFKRGSEAKKDLKSLKGVQPFVEDMLLSINQTLDGMAENTEQKLSDGFPEHIDNLIKELLNDKELNPLVKKGIEQVFYLIMQNVLKPAKGQTVEGRVLEVMENLVRVYNAQDPAARGAAWLKELMPEEMLKTILPAFLHSSVTHKNLSEWFLLPYIQQITAQKTEIEMENKKTRDEDTNVKNAQAFAREFLLGYTKPTAPEKGLSGYSGEVRKVEGGLLGMLGANENSPLAGMIKSYLDAVVAKGVRSLEGQRMLDPNFLSLALTEVLPLLGGEGKQPEDMPTQDQFVQESVKKLLKILFPDEKQDLPVPEIAKHTVYEKARVGMESMIKELTDTKSRIAWTIDCIIPFAAENVAELKKLQKEAEEVRTSNKNPESLFKSTLLKAAILQVDLKMKERGSWAITRLLARFFTRLFVFFSLRSRLYDFVSDPKTDDKIRAAIWSFLTFKAKESQSDDAIKKGLEGAADKMLTGSAILPGFLSSRAASGVAALFFKQNLTDLLPKRL